ncbi:MAG: protein phosphatase CheZ [Succinivibrio sp.]|jgi:chemotaxis protein CheZ|nr:protein phosphatase CheZ [Succinivibrio sp.]
MSNENADTELRHLTVDDVDDIRDLLEAGMVEDAEEKFWNIASQIHRDGIYEAVGGLTRDLHNAIVDFTEDERIKTIANEEIPDASERLRSIISMTDDAANSTLDAVDKCTPMIRNLTSTIDSLLPTWKELMNGQIDRYTFVTLVHKVDNLINKTQQNANELSSQLTKIMMAQGYQDLTGQMLQKVIRLVTEVEDKLIKFLVTFSGESSKDTETAMKKLKGIEPSGPAVGADKESEDVASSQDDVDDLLASLGF